MVIFFMFINNFIFNQSKFEINFTFAEFHRYRINVFDFHWIYHNYILINKFGI